MNRPFQNVAAWTALLCAALSSLACSALTRPDEVTISAEPLPARPAPAAAPAPGGAVQARNTVQAEKPVQPAPMKAMPGGGSCGQ